MKTKHPFQTSIATCLRAVSRFAIALLAGLVIFGAATGAAPGDEQVVLSLFVDAVHGDDNNDGKSATTPLRTLNAAQDRMDAAPGEGRVILNLARGSVWHEDYQYMDADGNRRVVPEQSGRWPAFSFGRRDLTVRAYGEGAPPTISGLVPLPNADFHQPFSKEYPAIWQQTVHPPERYWIQYHDNVGTQPAIIVDEESLLTPVYTPVPAEAKMRDYHESIEGIQTEEDALRFVQEHPGSFYPRDNGDGSVDFFINSGTDPRHDGRSYGYRVRSGFFAALPGNRWEDFRLVGMSDRNGPQGVVESIRNVQFQSGLVHNMLIYEGHFEDVLSAGTLRPDVPLSRIHGATGTAFHTHGPESSGLVYDRCEARNVSKGFYDHRGTRPLVILRDCRTENVEDFFSHGGHTDKAFVVGHRHSGNDGGTAGFFGYLSKETNMEDSIFRFQESPQVGTWTPRAAHLNFRNGVIYSTLPSDSKHPPLGTMQICRGAEFVYDHATLILDLEGAEIPAGWLQLTQGWGAHGADLSAEPPAKVVFRNSIIAVINAPQLKDGPDAPGDVLQLFSPNHEAPAEFVFENCVLTYLEGIPETAGTEGDGYVFAKPEEIFAGDPAGGDYSIRKGSPADRLDAGYREGREPIFRPMADQLAEEWLAAKGQ